MLTITGEVRSTMSPVPNWPCPFQPQQYATPALVNPHVWYFSPFKEVERIDVRVAVAVGVAVGVAVEVLVAVRVFVRVLVRVGVLVRPLNAVRVRATIAVFVRTATVVRVRATIAVFVRTATVVRVRAAIAVFWPLVNACVDLCAVDFADEYRGITSANPTIRTTMMTSSQCPIRVVNRISVPRFISSFFARYGHHNMWVSNKKIESMRVTQLCDPHGRESGCNPTVQ